MCQELSQNTRNIEHMTYNIIDAYLKSTIGPFKSHAEHKHPYGKLSLGMPMPSGRGMHLPENSLPILFK